MSTPLRICIVTGSRAEYGLFFPLLTAMKTHPAIELQLLVTGMHLSPEFGLTYKKIEQDGFTISRKVEMLLSGDTGVSISKSTGLGLIGFADAFDSLRPDWVVLLGDRFETLAAAIAAHLQKIPIAHIHGGELTEGATDDAFRHSISKMSYLHFTAAEEYSKRVMQLGEEESRVVNVGAIGLDNINSLQLWTREKLESDIGLDLTKKTILVTYHPVTLENTSSEDDIKSLLTAIESFPELQVIFTLPNADADGRVITRHINQFAETRAASTRVYTSLGQVRYLSLLQFVTAVVGNSSSGLIEAPSFGIPTVNIGDRQKGRLKASSIIDSGTSEQEIKQSLTKALSREFRIAARNTVNPNGKGNAAEQIISSILKVGRPSLKKQFKDLIQ